MFRLPGRALVAALLVSAAAAIAAHAQTAASDGQSLRNQFSGQFPAFMYEPDGTARIGRANQYGHQYVSEGLKDRDHWEFKGTGFQGDSVSASGFSKYGINGGAGLSFVDLKDYNQSTLLVSWAASSDSDSVAFLLFPVAKQSASDDGYDYVMDMDDSDSLMTGLYIYRGQWGLRLWQSNPNRLPTRKYTCKPNPIQWSLTESGNTTTLTYAAGLLSGYGVAIPFTDIAGSDWAVPITGFWVVNLHPRKPIAGLNINLWAKVK